MCEIERCGLLRCDIDVTFRRGKVTSILGMSVRTLRPTCKRKSSADSKRREENAVTSAAGIVTLSHSLSIPILRLSLCLCLCLCLSLCLSLSSSEIRTQHHHDAADSARLFIRCYRGWMNVCVLCVCAFHDSLSTLANQGTEFFISVEIPEQGTHTHPSIRCFH